MAQHQLEPPGPNGPQPSVTTARQRFGVAASALLTVSTCWGRTTTQPSRATDLTLCSGDGASLLPTMLIASDLVPRLTRDADADLVGFSRLGPDGAASFS